MNKIKLNGIVHKKWAANKTGKPVNLYLMDDTFRGSVRFHVAFWNEKDLETVNTLNEGDEIDFEGYITGISMDYNCIDINSTKIISATRIKKETEYLCTQNE